MSEPATFSFDAEFQTLLAAYVLRSNDFNSRCEGLLQPKYFSDAIDAGLVSLSMAHFEKYKGVPRNQATIKELIKEALSAKLFRKDQITEIQERLRTMSSFDIDEPDVMVDKVAEFARHQALSEAILDSVDLIDKRRFEEVEQKIHQASQVGAHEKVQGYDYAGAAEERRQIRHEIKAGARPKTGITTGVRDLDAALFHQGWGRKELSLYMGGPKSGKTTGLIDSARAAAMVGHNVLYVTLEVSAEIIGERLDANIAETDLKDLGMDPDEVCRRVQAATTGVGRLLIHEFPSGTMRPADLDRLINRYEGKGQKFDLVVVDYADLMAPNNRVNDSIENSKSIYVALRATAQRGNLAMLSATQTNREGFTQAVQRMEHVADDINKVRTADIVISINKTEDEKVRGEARLYFAASRNQEDGFTIRVKQALERGKFIARVLGGV